MASAVASPPSTRPRTSGAGPAACHRRRHPAPAWSALYLIAALDLAGLAAVPVVVPAGDVRRAALGVAALATFAAMALWIRANRIALALEDDAACCTTPLVVRVIRAPAGHAVGDVDVPPAGDSFAPVTGPRPSPRRGGSRSRGVS